MKTVLLLKSDYERIGGPETLLRNIAITLDRARFEPVLGIMRKPGEAPRAAYPDRMRQVALTWHGIAGLLATARTVAALARECNADIVHSHDMRTNLVACMMRLFLRRPWIAHVHGWLGTTHRGRWRLFEAIDRRLVRRADLVLVGSRAAQREVRDSGARDVEVVPNAVTVPPAAALNENRDALRASLCIPPDRVVLGMLGRLHPGKGQEHFLRALADLLAAGDPVHGLIVGEGPDEAQLRERAASLGIAENVYFTSYVDDALRYIPAMDIVAVPSLKDSLPLTALEAMAYGRPVVASDTGDLPIAVTHDTCGYIVPIGDVQALAARLGVLVRDPALRTRMGVAARQRVIDTYSAEAMARGLEDCYDAVLGGIG